MELLSIMLNIEQEIKNIITNNYDHKYYVIAEGYIHSNLLIIGEAMGREEEKKQRIFVGSSGKIVRFTLNKFNLQTFFLINTLPIRPPKNATPKHNEINLFANSYSKIINMPHFKYILALGKCAQQLLNSLNIKNYIGVCHPAYLLYTRKNPDVLASFENGFLKIAQYKDNILIDQKTNYFVFRGQITL